MNHIVRLPIELYFSLHRSIFLPDYSSVCVEASVNRGSLGVVRERR